MASFIKKVLSSDTVGALGIYGVSGYAMYTVSDWWYTRFIIPRNWERYWESKKQTDLAKEEMARVMVESDKAHEKLMEALEELLTHEAAKQTKKDAKITNY